mgnify:CR=1 FL=1
MEIGNKISILYNDIIAISFIEDIISESKILIQSPYTYKEQASLYEGNKYNIIINSKDKIINALVYINSHKITNRRKFYILDILKSFKEENQKRKYERYFCNLPYKIHLLDENKEEQINVIIKDISLGGIRFLSNLEIDKNSNLKIKIFLDYDYFLANGKIIQIQSYPKANYKNQYRIKFDNIENEYLLKNYFEKLKIIT